MLHAIILLAEPPVQKTPSNVRIRKARRRGRRPFASSNKLVELDGERFLVWLVWVAMGRPDPGIQRLCGNVTEIHLRAIDASRFQNAGRPAS